jgi:hypothetical protein
MRVNSMNRDERCKRGGFLRRGGGGTCGCEVDGLGEGTDLHPVGTRRHRTSKRRRHSPHPIRPLLRPFFTLLFHLPACLSSCLSFRTPVAQHSVAIAHSSLGS